MFEAINRFFREYVTVEHEGVMQSFRDGVGDATSTKNIFVDPDNIKDGDDLRQQLEAQHPGLTDQIWQTLQNEVAADNPVEFFDGLASHFLNVGASVVSPDQLQTEDGQDICFVNEPSRHMDQKEEIINAFRGNFENLDRNILVPGSDFDYARALGVHEGTHCEQDNDNYETKREQEIDADRAALRDQLERGNTSVAKEIYEAREIGAVNGSAYTHHTASEINYDKLLKDTFNSKALGETESQHTPPQPKVSAEPEFGPDF